MTFVGFQISVPYRKVPLEPRTAKDRGSVLCVQREERRGGVKGKWKEDVRWLEQRRSQLFHVRAEKPLQLLEPY